MSAFAKSARTARPAGVTQTTDQRVRTHEGGNAFALDAKTELFTLATTMFFGADTFYESGDARSDRLIKLAHEVTATDPAWMAQFIPWLRREANMRTVSVVLAVEYALHHKPEGDDYRMTGRRVLANSLHRADEPAEALAYHLSRYGKVRSYAVKRGIADAAQRLYNEYGVFKYDQQSANVRMGDVIDLCHPKPVAPWQADLFQYVLDRRHNRDNPRISERLQQTTELLEWRKAPTLDWLPNLITWENLSSYTAMDSAAWEAVIPKMGYMALLRNLRNFEQAGVDAATLRKVAHHLSDPEAVSMSRQLPFRFYNAYVNLHTDRFRFPVSEALEHSVNNIPQFPGKTLILIDTSGSMRGGYSSRGTVSPVKQAALFGMSVANRSTQAVPYVYADHCARFTDFSGSILRNTEEIDRAVGVVGHGTRTWQSLETAWRDCGGADRVMVFTDMQDHPSNRVSIVPKHVPVHVWDLSGNGQANLQLGSGRYLHAGLSDQSFKTVKMLEDFQPGRWPWES